MRLLSIDIGLKNLAYCLIETTTESKFDIIDWEVLNLCGEEPTCNNIVKRKRQEVICGKPAKYKYEGARFCKTCAKKSKYIMPSDTFNIIDRKRSRLSELQSLASIFDIADACKLSKTDLTKTLVAARTEKCLETIHSKNASKMDLITAGYALSSAFDNKPDMLTADIIVIENQISPLANRMRTLQGMVTQYFIMREMKDIRFVSAANKLKPFLNNCKTTYNERKKIAVTICIGILEKDKMMNWLQCLVHHKKKDDLADSFLQGMAFLQEQNLALTNYIYAK